MPERQEPLPLLLEVASTGLQADLRQIEKKHCKKRSRLNVVAGRHRRRRTTVGAGGGVPLSQPEQFFGQSPYFARSSQ